ncbi:MAG: AI-2E family transporter [Bacteroidia bacterium]|nr:AI-2E family transporter [Bacteroidia bacterium]
MEGKLTHWLVWIGIALIIYLCFTYLSNVILYFTISIILSFLGGPLVHILSEKGVGKIKIPRSMAAIFTLLIFALLIFGFILLFVPLISKQIKFLTSIDYNAVYNTIETRMSGIIIRLEQLNLWPSKEDWQSIFNKILSVFSAKDISGYFGTALSISTGILIAIFAAFFITFFLLKDAGLFNQIILSLTPEKYMDKVKNTIQNSKEMLSRYFLGLLIQITLISIVVWAGLAMIGVENALVLGLITGLLNIIPYIGPLISIVIGVLIGITSELAIASNVNIGIFAIKIFAVYMAVQLLDNIVFQPLIFSKSVNAHPLEIFIVVLIAGTLFGILGMIAAIPVYTIFRVIFREFFPGLKVVKKLTDKMNK